MDTEYCREVASVPSRLDSCLSLETNGRFNVHSPEDMEWADSCLVNHPEHLNGDWVFVKDALHEILKTNPSSSVSCSDVSMEQTDTDTKRFLYHQGTADYVFPAEDEADIFLSQILEGNASENYVEDATWPSYNGSIEAKRMKDKKLMPALAKEGVPEVSSVRRGYNRSLGLQIDGSIEEDGKQEFLKRLEKALKAVSVHLLPSALGGPVASKDVSVDDIIARVRQLSMDGAFYR